MPPQVPPPLVFICYYMVYHVDDNVGHIDVNRKQCEFELPFVHHRTVYGCIAEAYPAENHSHRSL